MADPEAHLLERLAHDLRGPLSPLQTAAYLLRSGGIEADRQGELLDIIDRQTARLSAMVQEVADWTRVEQGRLINHREVSNLPMLVELACGKLQTRGQPTAVDMRLPASLDEVGVDGDAQRLVQMFSTLMAYMQSRAVDVGVVIRGEPPTDGRVVLTIDQQGRNRPRSDPENRDAPAADRATLFSAPQPIPFDEGLGWRLMIAEAIAEAHGGSILAGVSDAGGTELTVDLPIAG